MATQLGTLDVAPGFRLGHPLAYQVAGKVTSFTPAGLDHVFFTNSGSESADTAMKMAKAYWRLKLMYINMPFLINFDYRYDRLS